MAEGNEFVSCFKIRGRLILPPVLTPRRRSEMHEYKIKALEIEKRLKERKDLLKEKGLDNGPTASDNLQINEEDDDKENKESIGASLKDSDRSLLNVKVNTKDCNKPLNSERGYLKELPCSSVESAISSLICQEAMASIYDLNYPEDGMCSVTPTESTDLQPYMDTTLEDVSSEGGGNLEYQENPRFQRRSTYFISSQGSNRDCTISPSIKAKLSALEDLLVFSPIENLEKCLAHSRKVQENKSDILEKGIEDTSHKDSGISESFRNDYIHSVGNSGMECQNFNNLFVDGLNKHGVLRSETNSLSPDEAAYSTSSPLVEKDVAIIQKEKLETDNVDVKSASNSEDDHQENSIHLNPPRLVRRGSYTLDCPSPILSANIERFKVSCSVVPGESIKTTVDLNKGNDTEVAVSNDAVLSHVCIADSAELVTDVVCTKNFMLTLEHTSKDMTEQEVISCELQTKTGASKAKMGYNKIPAGKKLPPKSIKGGIVFERLAADGIPAEKKLPPKSIKGGSVFERLAADGAKKAEERRKWGKETVFKKPVLKKVPKASKRPLRASVSSSNIRMSFSEAHRQRSSSLTDRRCNSDVNIGSIAPGKSWHSKNTVFQKSSNLSQSTCKTNQQRMSKKDKFDGVKEVSASTAIDKSLDLKHGSHSLPIKEKKELSQHDSPPSNKKNMYTVQTSPISPPLSMSSRDDTVEVDAAAAQRRKRRRWSESSGIWTSFGEPGSSNSSSDLIPSKDLSTLKKETKQSDNLQNITGLDKDCCLHDVENKASQEIPIDNFSSGSVCKETEVSKVEILEVAEKFDILSLDEVVEVQIAVKNIALGEDLEARKSQYSGEENPEKDMEKNLNSELKEISFNICTDKILTVNDHNDKIEEEVSVNLMDEKEDLRLQKENSTVVGVDLRSETVECLQKTEDSNLVSFSDSENARVQESVKEITTDLTYDLVSDDVQNGETNLSVQKFAVEEQKSKNNDDISIYSSPTVQVSSELQSTINSLPDSPKGVHGVKDTAVCLLNQFLDFQKIALEKLLEGQQRQVEEMQNQFKEQQKLFAEQLIHFVDDLPTSISYKTPSRNQRVFINTNVIAAVENRKLEEIKQSSDCMLLQSEDSPKINFSLCHICHSPSNTCKCSSREGSTFSSTLKEECSTVIGNLDEKSVNTCKSNEGETEVISSEDSECLALQSPLESNNPSPMTSSRIQDSTLSDLFRGMESTMIEGSSVANGDLDLSGIIEMETREKILSLASTAPSAGINVFQENRSLIISSLDQTNNLANNETLLDELTAHRQNYEDDVRRLSSVESQAGCVLGVAADSNSNSGLPLDNKENNFTKVEDCPVTLRKLITSQGRNANNESEIYFQSELPDLRSDLMALQTLLGAETLSTGPLNLETPISTSGFQSSECDVFQMDSASEHCTDDVLDDLNSVSSQVSKINDNYDEFRLAIEKSDDEMIIGENCEENHMQDKSPSILDKQKFTTDDSPSSELYTTASSSSQKQESVFLENGSVIFQAFNKLSAFVKGYLTRRLFKTMKVLKIKATIEDSLTTAFKLHSELSSVAEVNPVDVQLSGLILAQLKAACDEVHHIFFGLSIAQQMEIIRADREKSLSKTITPLIPELNVAPSPRPALLSAVTLKTLQRRFGDEITDKKSVAGHTHRSKSSGKLECTKKIYPEAKRIVAKMDASKEVFARPARSRTRSTCTEEGKGHLQMHKRQKTFGTEEKTAHVQHKPTAKKRKSRSSSEANRRPWR